MNSDREKVDLESILKDLMESSGLKIAELAAAINSPHETIRRILSGKVSHPTSRTIVALADYFNVSTDYLLGREKGKVFALEYMDLSGAKRPYFLPVVKWNCIDRWLSTEKPSCKWLEEVGQNVVAASPNLSQRAYALRMIYRTVREIVANGDFLVIDPGMDIESGSYVIAAQNKNTPSLYSVVFHENKCYLNPLLLNTGSVPVDDSWKILGTVVQSVKNIGLSV